LKKLEKAKIALPPDWLEDQVWLQQRLCNLRAAITNGGHQIPLPPLFILRPDKGHSV